MAQKLVTVFGGSGFVGTTLVEHLAKAGYRVRVAVRRPNSAMHVKPLGDVGQVQVVQANVRDEKSVAAAVIGSDMVINLVGVLFESGSQKFQTLHARGGRTGCQNFSRRRCEASCPYFGHWCRPRSRVPL